MKYVYVSVDTNDADYVGCLSKITDKEAKKIKKIAKVIAKFDCNWPLSAYENSHPEEFYEDILKPKEIELMSRFTDCETRYIDQIQILEVSSVEDIL